MHMYRRDDTATGRSTSSGKLFDDTLYDIKQTGQQFGQTTRANINVGVAAAWTIVVGLSVAVVIIFLVMGGAVLDVINDIAAKA